MMKESQKTIIIQADLSIDLLGSLSLALKKHPDRSIKDFFMSGRSRLVGTKKRIII